MYFIQFSDVFYQIPLIENFFYFLYMSLVFVSAREQPIWCPFPTDRTRTSSVDRWKRRGPWWKKGTEGCLFPAKVGIFPFINFIIKVLFPICTLIWRVNSYVFRQGKVKIGEMKVLLLLYNFQPFGIVLKLISNCLHFIETLFFHNRRR